MLYPITAPAGSIRNMTIPADLPTYRAFWPHYLAQHQRPLCRALHYAGTLLATATLLLLLQAQAWTWLWLSLLCGYAPAWLAHFFIEHNRPATWQHPLWSLRADYQMCWYWLSGQIDSELLAHRYLVAAPPTSGE